MTTITFRRDGSMNAIGGEDSDSITGTRFNDSIFGNGGRDVINGADGNDSIDGGAGLDTLRGNDGNDVLIGGDGDDELDGGNGNDVISGGDGNDTINAGIFSDDAAGDDLISGGNGDDTIEDVLGVDKISGGAGNDHITVAGGDFFRYDIVGAGSGNDTIVSTGKKVIVDADAGNDTIVTDLARDTVMEGGSGSDRFVLKGVSSVTGSGRVAEIHGGEVSVTLSSVFGLESIDSVTVGTDSSIDTLDLSQLTGFNVLNVHLGNGTLQDVQGVLYANMTGIENVVGSENRDIVTGNGVANEMHGGGGNDVLNGEGADDTLFGDAGEDSLSGGQGNDMLNGGDENDSLFGNSGNDILFGDSNNDTLNGGAGDDVVVGGTGNDTLNGSTGADVLYGDFYGDAVSRDTLTGGADADRFVILDVGKIVGPTGKVTHLNDRITDFDAFGIDHDTIDLSHLLGSRTSFAGGGAQEAFNQGFLRLEQHGTQGQAGFGTNVMVDFNGGTHGDTGNNFLVVDLEGVRAADVSTAFFLA